VLRLSIGLGLVVAMAVAVAIPDDFAGATGGPSVIDFEGLDEGMLVSEVSSGVGVSGTDFSGSIGIGGWQASDPTPRAMVFDGACLPQGDRSGCTGQDPDLFFPARGNLLIVSEDLDGSDPDDASDSWFTVDFSGVGAVTIESVGLLDTNRQTTEIELTLENGSTVVITHGGTGDNGERDVSIGVADVVHMRVDLHGLGGIDDIVFSVDSLPTSTTTTSTSSTTTTSTSTTTTTTVPGTTTTTSTSTTTTTTVPGTTTTTTAPGSTTTTTAVSGALDVLILVNGVEVGSGSGPEVAAGETGSVEYRITNLYSDKAYALYLKHEGVGEIHGCPDDDLEPGETVVCQDTITFVDGPFSARVVAKAWPESRELVGAATLAYTGTGGFVNVAPDGVATQADSGSWGSGAPARLAIDGNRDGDRDGGSVAMTYRVVGPWWEVDLGDVYEIDHVSLWNRTDCCGDRLQRFHVFVSDEPFQVHDVANTQSQPGVLDIYHHDPVGTSIDLPVDRTGRYVRVQLGYQDAVLQLAEVEVAVAEAAPVPPPAAGLELDARLVGGPFVAGDPVTFEYEVTNVGQVRLWAPYVRYDGYGAADCPDGAIQPGATVLCTASIDQDAGDWAETVTAKAWSDTGEVAVASETVAYTVEGAPQESEIELQVTLDGQPVAVPGPEIPFGGTLAWEYTVSNVGTNNLWSLHVEHGDAVVQCPVADLAEGESTVCARTSLAAAGDHVEPVTVSAWDSYGLQVFDAADAGYRTEIAADSSSMALTAAVDGSPAPTAPGPVVAQGSPLPLTFTASNTGSVSLYSLWVNVPGFGTATCPDRDMVPGESVVCHLDDPATPGQFSSTVRSVAYNGAGEEIEAFDQLHFFVPESPGGSVHLDVLVDGLNGDQHAGPRIALGQVMTFTYLVTNGGSIPLSDVSVTDSTQGTVSCPAGSLSPGGLLVCSRTETADELDTFHFDSTVTAGGSGGTVSDSERLYYHVRERGREEALSLDVTIGGHDADSPPGPALEVGRTVQLRYVLTNTSTQTAVYSASVSDPRVPESQISCSGGPFLQRGRSMICTATITVSAGDWANVVSARAYGQNGARIDASDRVHYTGVL